MNEYPEPGVDRFADLRRRAEAQVLQHLDDLSKLTQAQIESLVHELQVHQIELELQNEQLRQTQTDLEIMRDQYADLYDFAPVGYLTLDDQGLILSANLTIASLLEVERASLIRRPLSRFVVNEDQDAYYLFRRRLLGTHLMQVGEVRLLRQAGTYFYARLEAIVRDEREAPVCRITVSDVSDHKEAEQYILRTERLAAMGRLATTLAHEIKNPLQALRFSIDLVLGSSLDPEQRTMCLQICDRELNQLIDLTKNVLDFARPERKAETLATVTSVMGDTLALVDELVRASHVQVMTDLPLDLPTLQAEPDQIVRILINVIINAIEAMPDGGWIHITSEVAHDFISLNVANQGPPISPEDLKHVFDPFFTTKSGGTGLGLSISRDAMRRFNGDLTVGNLDDGQGVVVTLKIPVAGPAVS
jgi:PAS domain S-box-containing protein